jgi:hypothetical protein
MSSLRRIAETCFSTDPGETLSAAAIAALEMP